MTELTVSKSPFALLDEESDTELHPLLLRQARRASSKHQCLSPAVDELLKQVNEAYQQFDREHELLERSLELSSAELTERFQLLRDQFSELEQTKSALEQVLSQVEATLDATEDGILVVDLEGQIVRVNRRYLEIWQSYRGLVLFQNHQSVSELLKSRVKDFPKHQERLEQIYQSPDLSTKDQVTLVNGSVIERYSQPYRVDGVIVGRVWSYRDVTQAEQSAKALKHSQLRLETAQQVAQIGDLTCDLDGTNLNLTYGALAILGAEGESLEGLEDIISFVHPNDRTRVEVELSQLLDNVGSTDIEFAVGRDQLRPRYVSMKVGVFRGGSQYLVTLQDVTKRKRDEVNLKLASEVIDAASEGIVITTAEPKIIKVNKAFCDIMGVSEEEVLGLKPGFQKSGRHSDDFFQSMWHSINTTGRWQGEIWDRRSNGEVFPKWLSISEIRNADGQLLNYIGIFSDISKVKKAEERLKQLAYHDQLTQLPNRILLHERIETQLRIVKRRGSKAALLYLDLDRFKHVNDSLGHLAGDELLKQVAVRLQKLVRTTDTLARLGGDEFTVLLTEVGNEYNAEVVAQNIIEQLAKPFRIRGNRVHIGTSIGICMLPDDAEDLAEALRVADTAMYQAKANGKGCFQFYNPELNRQSGLKLIRYSELLDALKRDEMFLVYQPQIDIQTNKMIGLEALVRWRHPRDGVVTPDQFIPLAEETNVIGMLGAKVIEMACRQAKRWLAQGVLTVPISVNLSAKEFVNHDLKERLLDTLNTHEIPAHLLELEITESSAMDNAGQSAQIMESLRQVGVGFSIDDFGTGYSSLAYLKRFPASKLKIDRSFVRDITVDSNDAAIVKSIVSLAKALGLHVVAEGVETIEQLDMLREFGCHSVQGYYFARPLVVEEVTPLVAESYCVPWSQRILNS